jgi:hypothetical protein
MYETHYFTVHKSCPCQIGEDSIKQAADIYKKATSISAFVDEMESQRVIGKRIAYDEAEHTIFIVKMYACDSGGGCPQNKTLIGERCHCDHYNHCEKTQPLYSCKCGAEFYRPMFAPLFGKSLVIEPYKTVLNGDDECVLAIRIGKWEEA